ncbi:iron chaperone [Streptomyces parvus]|uniref:iron chaperone n=1 Tax=Streptomyces parvus TaxID=66428 RepID=UPI003323742F
MVQSSAQDVDQYLAEAPEARREALTRLRALCRQELTGFREVMAYGMPAYEREGPGTGEIAFADQKQYISFYLLRTDVRDAFADRLASHDMGKGCLRFRNPQKIDFEFVRDLLRATAATPGTPC